MADIEGPTDSGSDSGPPLPPTLTHNVVAATVRKRLADAGLTSDGVVALSGLLDEVIPEEPGLRRIYVDDTFTTWLLVKEDDIFGQIVSTSTDEPRDVFFVRFDADIQHIRGCRAHAFMESTSYGATTDPTAPADYRTRGIWPRDRP
jgi:hypothetical protein